MHFLNTGLITNSSSKSLYWGSHVQNFSTFPNMEFNGVTLDFSLPLDYFDLSSNVADRLKRVGEPYDFFSKPLPIPLNEFAVNIFDGFNDNDGIGMILRHFTNPERERSCYAVYASYFLVASSVYSAVTVCYVDKDIGEELDTVILEIGQDEEAYVAPHLISEEAAGLFSFDDMRAVGQYLANVWFGIQYEMQNRPEEIRVVEQRGPINPSGDYHEGNHIVFVKRIIGIDENGNEIKYSRTDSSRVYKMPAWGVRGHQRKFGDGRIVKVRPYIKGTERQNLSPKEYRFVDDKIEEDVASEFSCHVAKKESKWNDKC